jgi:hypothetical protein
MSEVSPAQQAPAPQSQPPRIRSAAFCHVCSGGASFSAYQHEGSYLYIELQYSRPMPIGADLTGWLLTTFGTTERSGVAPPAPCVISTTNDGRSEILEYIHGPVELLVL